MSCFYRDFIYQLRLMTLDDGEIYIILTGDVTPKLKRYVKLLDGIKIIDGSYHLYYGQVKKIINSFYQYYEFTINRAVLMADKYTNELDRGQSLCLIEETIGIHVGYQVDFSKEFLPVKSPEEKQMYENVLEKYDSTTEKLNQFRDTLKKIDRQDKVRAFAREHFKLSLKKTSEIFAFTHNFISLYLVQYVNDTLISIDDVRKRMTNNLRNRQQIYDEKLNSLMIELYNKNKEQLLTTRQDRLDSIKTSELEREIVRLRDRIDKYKTDIPPKWLKEEVKHWENKAKIFRVIADLINKIRKGQEEISKEQKIYESLECKDILDSKKQTWEMIGRNLKERKETLNEQYAAAAKALFTAFAVKGSNRVLYDDDVGRFFLDEYRHQVYSFDYGMKYYHRNCDGSVEEYVASEKYYYDDFGRYTLDQNNEKLYRLAPCTSTHKLTEDNLLAKVTVDCGHSEAFNEHCQMYIRDPSNAEMLPDVEAVDIRNTLDPEVTKYLWDSFGCILPNALHDVAVDRPVNPIQRLAHKLLMHKYRQSFGNLSNKKEEADKYRNNIKTKRKEKLILESKAWKSKQVKHRKPEESDDAQERAIFDAQFTEQQFINSTLD